MKILSNTIAGTSGVVEFTVEKPVSEIMVSVKVAGSLVHDHFYEFLLGLKVSASLIDRNGREHKMYNSVGWLFAQPFGLRKWGYAGVLKDLGGVSMGSGFVPLTFDFSNSLDFSNDEYLKVKIEGIAQTDTTAGHVRDADEFIVHGVETDGRTNRLIDFNKFSVPAGQTEKSAENIASIRALVIPIDANPDLMKVRRLTLQYSNGVSAAYSALELHALKMRTNPFGAPPFSNSNSGFGSGYTDYDRGLILPTEGVVSVEYETDGTGVEVFHVTEKFYSDESVVKSSDLTLAQRAIRAGR